MENNLLCPMQMRMHDVKINECPRFLSGAPNDESHSIFCPKAEDFAEGYRIPLHLHGVTSYFNTRKPTTQEYETCRQLELTYGLPSWNPHSITFSQQEEAFMDSFGRTRKPEWNDRYHDRHLCLVQSSVEMLAAQASQDRERAQIVGDRMSQCSSVLADVSNTLNDDSFASALASHVNVSHTSSSLMTGRRKNMISPEVLVKRWCISLEAATKTLDKTTQKGIRTVANPSISRRFRTNDRQLRYRRLRTTLFTDTMFSKIPSRRGNTCAQIFCDQSGWTRIYPMKRKGEAHEALSLLFHESGVPHTMVADGSKEQMMGDFRKKARQADCYLKQTEPYTPWSNAAEDSIKELKRGTGRQMLKRRSPKRLCSRSMTRFQKRTLLAKRQISLK
jgi:hypothetical protein